MTVSAPSSPDELRRLFATAIAHDGPFAIRYPRGTAPTRGHSADAAAGDRPDVGAARGRRCGAARGREDGRRGRGGRRSAAGRGISCTVVDARFVKPLDTGIPGIAAGTAPCSPSRTAPPSGASAMPSSRRWPRPASPSLCGGSGCRTASSNTVRRPSCCTSLGLDAEGVADGSARAPARQPAERPRRVAAAARGKGRRPRQGCAGSRGSSGLRTGSPTAARRRHAMPDRASRTTRLAR